MIGAAAFAAHAGELPPEIERVLTGHGIAPTEVSIVVQAVDDDKPLLSHLAEVPRSPASVMKVVTTWSALEYLGPAYTWPTEVYFLGEFDGRKLDGDLALKGYGDPYLVVEEVWKLLRTLRRMGLTEITGDLVLDDSYFAIDEPDPGAFDGQPYRTYNVVPNALLMNFKAVQFQFMADPAHGRVSVATEPMLTNLEIDNNLALVDGPCRGYQAGISFNHAEPESLERVVLDGQFSRRCNVYGLGRTVLQHDTFAFGLFSSLWKEVGGSFGGKLRKAQMPPEAADATPALTPALVWRSKPLGEIVRSINKNSNNVMTRQLLYTLGAEVAGAPGHARERRRGRPRAADGARVERRLADAAERRGPVTRRAGVDAVSRRSFAGGLSQPVRPGVHRVAVARRPRRHDARPLRRGADGRRHAPENGPPRPRVRGRRLRAVGDRPHLRRRRRHEQRGRAPGPRPGARGSRAALHARAA